MREIRCPFLTLFRFRGSRGGPLGETPSPSRPTWLSETPSLGVGGGRRGSPSPGANRRIRPKPAGAGLGPREGGPGIQPRDPRQILPRFLDIKRPFVAQKGSWRPLALFSLIQGGQGGGGHPGGSSHTPVLPRDLLTRLSIDIWALEIQACVVFTASSERPYRAKGQWHYQEGVRHTALSPRLY